MKPKRLLASAPQTYDTKDTSKLLLLYKGRSFADAVTSEFPEEIPRIENRSYFTIY